MTFTEADRRKLEALKTKERQARQDARNEAKRNDRICTKLFGMTAKQVADRLSAGQTEQTNYYEQELNDIAELYGTDIETLIEYIKSDRQVEYYTKYGSKRDTF